MTEKKAKVPAKKTAVKKAPAKKVVSVKNVFKAILAAVIGGKIARGKDIRGSVDEKTLATLKKEAAAHNIPVSTLVSAIVICHYEKK